MSTNFHAIGNDLNVCTLCRPFSPALGRISEAISEYYSNREDFTDATMADENYSTEMTIAYCVLLQQWLPHREPKVCTEILQALSHIYPLLSHEKILEQAPKVIPQLQGFYRRSMDRNAITQLLASVLKTTIDADCNSLEGQSDSLISNLFDLVCVIPVSGCDSGAGCDRTIKIQNDFHFCRITRNRKRSRVIMRCCDALICCCRFIRRKFWICC